MDYLLEPSRPGDDAALRGLMAEPVPGRVSVAFERSPSFFAGCGTLGRDCRVVVARHAPTGDLAGVACRAVRRVYVNGAPEEFGYLGQLRVHPRHRGRWIVPAGFRLLDAWHRERPVAAYLTTITEENPVSRGVLVDRARRRQPAYEEVARIRTLALAVPRRSPAPTPGIAVGRGAAGGLGRVLSVMRALGPVRQFTPAWEEEDFAPGAAATLGFLPADFAVATRAGAPVAVAGLWDQAAYKQPVVRGYAPWLGRLRRLVNAVGRLRGFPGLPPPGTAMRVAYAGFFAAAAGETAGIRAVVADLLANARTRGVEWLVIGLAVGDPALPVLARWPHAAYDSRLYLVTWAGDARVAPRLDGRVPHVDVATL